MLVTNTSSPAIPPPLIHEVINQTTGSLMGRNVNIYNQSESKLQINFLEKLIEEDSKINKKTLTRRSPRKANRLKNSGEHRVKRMLPSERSGDVSKLLIMVSGDKLPDNLIMNVY